MFLNDIANEYRNIIQAVEAKNSSVTPPFIHEFFNVKMLNDESGAELAMSRIVNALIKEVNKPTSTLPQYLVVIADHDLVTDLPETSTETDIQRITAQMVRQVNTVIRCKRVSLFEKKPGALSGFSTKVIFVKMICRIGTFKRKTGLTQTKRAIQ